MSLRRRYRLLVEQKGAFEITVLTSDEESADEIALELLVSEPLRFKQVFGDAGVLEIEEVLP